MIEKKKVIDAIINEVYLEEEGMKAKLDILREENEILEMLSWAAAFMEDAYYDIAFCQDSKKIEKKINDYIEEREKKMINLNVATSPFAKEIRDALDLELYTSDAHRKRKKEIMDFLKEHFSGKNVAYHLEYIIQSLESSHRSQFMVEQLEKIKVQAYNSGMRSLINELISDYKKLINARS